MSDDKLYHADDLNIDIDFKKEAECFIEKGSGAGDGMDKAYRHFILGEFYFSENNRHLGANPELIDKAMSHYREAVRLAPYPLAQYRLDSIVHYRSPRTPG